MTRFPNPQLARQWRQRLRRFADSDLTIAEFCRLEGYSIASFYQWRRKLADDDQTDAPTFVPIKILPGDLQQPLPAGFQVDLPGGARINIPAGAALIDYRNLIQAVVDATAAVATATNDEVIS